MDTQTIKEKIAQMKEKYLEDWTPEQVDGPVCLDDKKAAAIKKKLVHLESLRCQKLRSAEDLTEIDGKINKLKAGFKALETEQKTRS